MWRWLRRAVFPFQGAEVKILARWLASESQHCADRTNDPSNKFLQRIFLWGTFFVCGGSTNHLLSHPQCVTTCETISEWTHVRRCSKDWVVNVVAVNSYHLQQFVEIMDGSGLILHGDEAREAAKCLWFIWKHTLCLPTIFPTQNHNVQDSLQKPLFVARRFWSLVVQNKSKFVSRVPRGIIPWQLKRLGFDVTVERVARDCFKDIFYV